jgi:hypothetical protein
VTFRLKQKTASSPRPAPTSRCARAFATILAADVSVDAVMADVQGRVRERLRLHLVRHGAAPSKTPRSSPKWSGCSARRSKPATRTPCSCPSCSASRRRGGSRPR